MPSSPGDRSSAAQLTEEAEAEEARPAVSVVVPVYGEGDTIVENARIIRERVAAKLREPFELIVVSDGDTAATEELVESGLARVIQYDRNLGKGYAVKAGGLAATGRWISFVDADLDLDPAAIPDFVEVARRGSFDIVIGSKRHPRSQVDYPRTRRVGSWLYQQLVRLLFRLDVRDTQVGLKVFRREVAEDVLPLLLVKEFAFDLELLAVARALGYRRIREEPVRLEYRFTGSGVRPVAVLMALIDTAAIFYRLRILRYYRRKRELLPAYARAREYRPRVTLFGAPTAHVEYEGLEARNEPAVAPEERAAALQNSTSEIVAFLEEGAKPPSNWLEATIPFLADPHVAAVVTPTMAQAEGTFRERAGAALRESWLGGGSHYFRFTPGNLRFVRHYPGRNLVARRTYCLELEADELHPHRICAALAERGRFVLYTPETVVVTPQLPLFRAQLEQTAAAGQMRGAEVRRHGWKGITAASVPPVGLLVFLLFGWPLAIAGGGWRLVWVSLWVAYAAAVAAVAALGALRFKSLRVGALTAIGIVAVHVTYAVNAVRGVLRRPAS